MSGRSSILRAVASLSPLRKKKRWNYYGHPDLRDEGAPFAERWRDVEEVADLRPGDRVLDMGCAEGLITLEAARRVARIDGVEISPSRVERAKKVAAERGVGNADFAAGSVIDHPLAPMSYDVVMFLGVLGKKTPTGRVGLAELERLLKAARRQIVVRKNVVSNDDGLTLAAILAKLDEQGFDGICFWRPEGHGNMIVGNRRGTDARLRSAPPLVLVPAESMTSHPCLRGVPVIRRAGPDEGSRS